MATIKRVKVKAITYKRGGYYWGWTTFKTFTDDHGNKTYYVNDKVVSNEEGNKRYMALRESNNAWKRTKDYKAYVKHHPNENTFEVTTTNETVTYEELIERCENAIDKYVEYIEDGKQYRQACEANEALGKEIDYYKKLIAER